MLLRLLWLSGLSGLAVATSSSQSIVTLSGTRITGADAAPTGSIAAFVSDFTTQAFSTSGSMSGVSSSMAASNTSASSSRSTSNSVILLVGGYSASTKSGNSTATSTTSSVLPTNTQPCNGYPEFCTRKYSNITEVTAHNSPFDVKNNAASNQALGVTTQLNDGIRMLQGQTHIVNGTLYYCHTSCDLLNAGTVENYLIEVAAWVRSHPYDVITILLGNGDYTLKDDNGNPLVTSANFVDPITKAGLMPYVYQPPKNSMTLDDWPTLSEMILSQKRVVFFIDYNFDYDAAPWILWEFQSMWETPYSPTDPAFPCTVQRPENLSENNTNSWLYMANHNLNVAVSIAGSSSLLIPNSVAMNVTNGLTGEGSLGNMTRECTADHGRPPNFLLVDYYNVGPFNGSVFEVAAEANNVTYNGKCCGTTSSFGVRSLSAPSAALLALVVSVMAAVGSVL
ncbi:PLC-like phosphodiesterase [Mytilinidion resinicola]|uniref:PLC-like phosphodiesterase n=1 Tax=Mytilinidion resinicola TaxID=574789 RepID=A0A6A6YL81_9PEZI|nr:PLC-like phosphodiesterase [Mytilinidion resinicola]KAF2809636.1 PLC-like phosphodiesterase [Mytilinidion resinicola]